MDPKELEDFLADCESRARAGGIRGAPVNDVILRLVGLVRSERLCPDESCADAQKDHNPRGLSDFNRSVVEEIERRGIDAIVEPEDSLTVPTTLRFRSRSGGFVWIPIIAFSVVDGPVETRAARTVDRMLTALRDVSDRANDASPER